MRNLTLSLKLARLSVIGLVCALVTAAPSAITAQALFSPAIKVNDEVITWFELQQRAQLLLVLQAPGASSSSLARLAFMTRRIHQPSPISPPTDRAAPPQIIRS